VHAPPELSRHTRLAKRDTHVWSLLTKELAPDEPVEAWCYAQAYTGPRSWRDVLPYLLAGLWLEWLGLLLNLYWRRIRALVGLDPMLYRPQPYVLIALMEARVVVTRIELGGLDGQSGVRAVGALRAASGPGHLRLSRLLRATLLELEEAPDCAVLLTPETGPDADARARRGAHLCSALKQRGWL
jgi:hypothetical protein